MKNYDRHGDVLITKVDELPEWLIKQDHLRLAEWEVTWHAHRLSGGTFYKTAEEPSQGNNYTVWYFVVEDNGEEVALTHEEHKTLIYTPWVYWVWLQREYDELEERRVVD